MGHGRLYIADRGNNRVREVDLATGAIRTVAGSGLLGFAAADSVALEASMNRPHDVALSADGRSLFVADTHNHRVRLVDIHSGRISTFAGTGSTELPQDGLDAAQTPLREPAGLAALGSRVLFLSDGGHHVVWRVRFSR